MNKEFRTPSDRRTQILDAAANLLAERGYHKTSMDAIALAVGIQKASLYHHFKNKQALVLALHQEIIDILFGLHRARMATAPIMTPAHLLFEMMFDLIRLAETHRGHLSILFDYYRELPESIHQEVSAKRKSYRLLVADILRRGVAAGEFGEMDVEFAARAVMGMCNWATRWYRPTGALRARSLAERTWKMLVMGLGPRPSRQLPEIRTERLHNRKKKPNKRR